MSSIMIAQCANILRFIDARCRFSPVDKVLLLGAVILIGFVCIMISAMYAGNKLLVSATKRASGDSDPSAVGLLHPGGGLHGLHA
jgi:hypothetical protein